MPVNNINGRTDMEKHSKHFEYLENYFEGIERYAQYRDTAISTKSFQFWIILTQVNTDFHSFGKITLMDDELPIVQGWINKLLANPYIPRKTRDMIAEESVKFASMMGSISNSHIDTIDSLNF